MDDLILQAAHKVGRDPDMQEGYCVTIAVVYRDDNDAIDTHIHSNTNCHAGLNSIFDGECECDDWGGEDIDECNYCSGEGDLDGVPLAIVSSIHLNHNMAYDQPLDETMAAAYLEWLVNASPYREVFYKQAGVDVLGQGYVIADALAPANLLAGALVASRRVWEFNTVVHTMHGLRERGVSANLAWVVAHAGPGSSGEPDHMYLNPRDDCHQSCRTKGMTDSALRDWAGGQLANTSLVYDRGPYDEERCYSGYSAMFNYGVGGKIQRLMDEWMFGRRKGDAVNLNPFVKWAQVVDKNKPRAKQGGVPFRDGLDELAERLIPQIQEILNG